MKLLIPKRLLITTLLSLYVSVSTAQPPQLTIVIVIDQCAYRNLDKVRPFLRGGLRFLCDEGIFYTHIYVPYAWPATGPGHTTLNTGTLPKTHGIINNAWMNENGQRVNCDDDDSQQAAVLGLHGVQSYGKSPHNIMVDGLSDQLVLQDQQHKNYQVWSISLKSRSAITTANKLGKAIWFDTTTGSFTSSKAYFNKLPS